MRSLYPYKHYIGGQIGQATLCQPRHVPTAHDPSMTRLVALCLGRHHSSYVTRHDKKRPRPTQYNLIGPHGMIAAVGTKNREEVASVVSV